MKFGFPRPAGHPKGQGKWRCPNCGGNCFGGAAEPKPFRYYCHGMNEEFSCGYWETSDEPRQNGIRK